MNFTGFTEQGESRAGFEDERKGIVIGRSAVSEHKIEKSDRFCGEGATRVGSEHEIPGEDIRVTNLKEEGSREGEVMIMGERRMEEFTGDQGVPEDA